MVIGHWSFPSLVICLHSIWTIIERSFLRGCEFIKNPSLIFNIIHPDDQIKFETHTHESKTNKTPGEVEFRIIRADGRELWISHICQPVFDESGLFIGTRGSNRDITERKHAEGELQLANEKLRLQLAEIEDLQVILRKQALHDPLTG